MLVSIAKIVLFVAFSTIAHCRNFPELDSYKEITRLGLCPIKVEPVGCYSDNLGQHRALSNQLLNGRDPSSTVFVEPFLEWKTYNHWLINFICKCAIVSHNKGHPVFGIQYFGECWAAGLQHTKHGESKSCISPRANDKPIPAFSNAFIQQCDVPATGQALTNFVYRVSNSDCPLLDYESVGCYRDKLEKPRPLRHYIQNERDYSIPNWNGQLIDWKNWNDYSPAMICRCAQAAKAGGYDYFGIQFYGECWASTEAEINLVPYDKDGPFDQCLGKDYKPCACNSYQCVGKAKTNYVYKFKSSVIP